MINNNMIVAVDDSSVTLMMIEKVLKTQGYEIKGFSKGSRALKYLHDNTPKLIILDIDMPEINGFEMLEMIKGYENLTDIPVMFLTSNGGQDAVISAVKGGAKDYVVKPINEDILIDKVNKLFGVKRKRQFSFDD